MLLSAYTENYAQLIIGTNLGGLGTLIASMASLISYKQIAVQYPAEKEVSSYFYGMESLVFDIAGRSQYIYIKDVIVILSFMCFFI